MNQDKEGSSHCSWFPTFWSVNQEFLRAFARKIWSFSTKFNQNWSRSLQGNAILQVILFLNFKPESVPLLAWGTRVFCVWVQALEFRDGLTETLKLMLNIYLEVFLSSWFILEKPFCVTYRKLNVATY